MYVNVVFPFESMNCLAVKEKGGVTETHRHRLGTLFCLVCLLCSANPRLGLLHCPLQFALRDSPLQLLALLYLCVGHLRVLDEKWPQDEPRQPIRASGESQDAHIIEWATGVGNHLHHLGLAPIRLLAMSFHNPLGSRCSAGLHEFLGVSPLQPLVALVGGLLARDSLLLSLSHLAFGVPVRKQSHNSQISTIAVACFSKQNMLDTHCKTVH